MIRGIVNIVKRDATEIMVPQEKSLYFNAIDIPLLHTKIRKVAIKI
jgi:hypothetical protein